MALRIRSDGTVLCAAMHPELPGDVYLDDGAHYTLSVDRGLLVTEPMEIEFPPGVHRPNRGGHAQHGQWWWAWEIPADVAADLSFVPAER